MAERYTKGFRDLALTLRALPSAMAKTTLRAGVLAGAVVVRDAARQNVHVRTGLLRSDIIVKYIPEESSRTKAVYFVTVRHGPGEVRTVRSKLFDVTTGEKVKYKFTQNVDAFYWWWVEFGKHVKHHQVAMPYMRPAFSDNVDRTITTIGDKIRSLLPAAVLAAKGGRA